MFYDAGPPGANRKEILLDFCLKAVMETSDFFIGNVANEMNLQRQLAEDAVRKLQEELKEHKSEQKERVEALETRIRKTEIEKAEMSAKEQGSREALQQL